MCPASVVLTRGRYRSSSTSYLRSEPIAADFEPAADELIATTDITAVITLVEHEGQRTVVASGEAEIGGRAARPDDAFCTGCQHSAAAGCTGIRAGRPTT